MSTEAPAPTTAAPINHAAQRQHATLAAEIRRLIRLRAELESESTRLGVEIQQCQDKIVEQAFALFPGLDQSHCFWNGDPVEFLAGDHQVTLYHNKDQHEVEVTRIHKLEIADGLFSEEGGVR